MAAHQLCTFFLDNTFFGIDVRVVQEVIRYQEMTRVPRSTPVISGLINLRGQIVTAVEMRKRLGLPDRPADRLPMNVVVRSEGGPYSLLVDEIDDVVEVDERDYEPVPDTLPSRMRELVKGVYKLDRRRLLLELDSDRDTIIGMRSDAII